MRCYVNKCSPSFTDQLSLVHLEPAGDPRQRVSQGQSRPLDPKTLKHTTQAVNMRRTEGLNLHVDSDNVIRDQVIIFVGFH